MRRAGAVACLLAGTVAAAGCAQAPSPVPDTSATAASDGPLSAQVTQFRRDQPLRRVQLRLHNAGSEPVALDAVRLDAPAFAALPDTPRTTRLPPGARVDVPVPYGEVDCAAPLEGADGAVAVATLRIGDGAARQLRVPLGDAGGALARVRERECAVEELAATAELALSSEWPEARAADGRPALQPVLRVTRRTPSRRVVVDRAGGHVLFTVRARDGREPPLLVLEPGQESAELPLEVVTTRCDAHALAESKRTPLFLFAVGLDEEEPRLLAVTAPDAVLPALSAFAARSCRG
jgi:hypothetical protein